MAMVACHGKCAIFCLFFVFDFLIFLLFFVVVFSGAAMPLQGTMVEAEDWCRGWKQEEEGGLLLK